MEAPFQSFATRRARLYAGWQDHEDVWCGNGGSDSEWATHWVCWNETPSWPRLDG
jgi:hypothetical protein